MINDIKGIDLEVLNYSGFSEEQIIEIKKTCNIFLHFRFSPNSKDWDWIRIDGSVFDPNNTHTYYVTSFGKDAFNVQVVQNGKSAISYWFGVVFTYDDSGLIKDIRPYHHPMD